MTSPNDLVWSTLLIFSPSISISISSLWVSNLCLDPIIINSVFATFRLSLFAFSQRLRLLSSGFISNFNSVNVFAVKLMLVSSANILEEAFSRQLGKSLMYIKNSEGRFTRHNFVACDKLTTSLRHESFRVNETYNLLTIVAYDTKNVVGFWNMF